MRSELRGISESDHWVYGLSENDLEYILRLAHDFVAARYLRLDHEVCQARCDYPDPTIYGEIFSDLAHYTDVDIQFLWQFCLWRFQGILEGLITHTFLPERPQRSLSGLRAKLDSMRAAGYAIDKFDYQELVEWARVRNILSHCPPEQYRPGPLRESDILEYKDLVERVCRVWRGQEKAVKSKRARE